MVGESHIDFPTQCVIMTQIRRLPTPTCVIPRILSKSIVFLKPVLNIFILGNLIVGWGEGVIKEGLVFCMKPIDLGEVSKVRGSSSLRISAFFAAVNKVSR